MAVETVRMSSKGQIVIPREVREELHAEEGTLFAVVGANDAIVLKKIATPSKEELVRSLARFAHKATMRLQGKGITEKDLQAK